MPHALPQPKRGAVLVYRVIGAIASLIMIAIGVFATVAMYRFVAPFVLICVVWSLYLLRQVLGLHPVTYGLLVSALLLHMLGAFGYYQESPLPVSFDIVVHFYFALVITIALSRAFAMHYPTLLARQRIVLTFFFMMGLAALHEVMEYGTYLVLGEERGMLKPRTSYFLDTSRDLTNNLLGTLAGLAVTGIGTRWLRGDSRAFPSTGDENRTGSKA